MESLINTSIEEILGEEKKRYFANGFRFFSSNVIQLEYFLKELHGKLSVIYNGPIRPNGEQAHIGSIELMAFSLLISTFAINRICNLNITDTNRAFLKNYSIQIKNSMSIGTYKFKCRVISTNPDNTSLQGFISLIIIEFTNYAKIKLTIDHKGSSSLTHLKVNELISIDLEQLHSIGYKSTEIKFEPLEIDIDKKSISTSILYKHLLQENTFNGVGSARNNLLPTDAIRIYGQLMQALLYKLSNTDRNTCPNIWLRKMHFLQERPLFKEKIHASIIFEDIRQIYFKGENWKLIKLSGAVGNYNGSFHIAHKENR